MRRILTLTALAFAVNAATATPAVIVNCDHGVSLNRTLARLDKQTPITVRVLGTCTEYVQISGFEGLTLRGAPGATLVQPSEAPPVGVRELLLIESSRSVTLDGFKVHAALTLSGISIGRGSADIRLRNLTIEGGGEGIIVWENSQVSIARVTARDPGFAPVGIYDKSDVHIEDCLFEHSTGEQWHHGIDVGSGHLTLHGTTIRNMQVGMSVSSSGSIDLVDFDSYYPLGGPSEVVIENPAGTNFNGVQVSGGSSLNLGTKLRITNPGQSWGGDTGGVLVRDGSTLNAGGNLEVSGSQGQGIFVTNNSHVSLGGGNTTAASSIAGSGHNGLVVVNNSSVAVAGGGSIPPTEIIGSAASAGSNAKDLFCDSSSVIAGGANLAYDPAKAQCDRLLVEGSEPIPW